MPKGVYTRKPFTEKHCKNMSKSRKGKHLKNHKLDCLCPRCVAIRGEAKAENCNFWKGDRANSNAKHIHIRKYFGKANHCSNLNCLEKCKYFEWSKIDHNTFYTRNIEEYQQLCRSCHILYDRRKMLIDSRYGY